MSVVKPEDISCPVCGYYCTGKGGHGCIDKPTLVFGKPEPKSRQEIIEEIAIVMEISHNAILKADEQIDRSKVCHSRINELLKKLNESGVAWKPDN